MTVISKTISPCAPDKTACACGECGGLECLCRPRFFAGQLLTEGDLNRLDSYVRTRFRMHNLSLHGSGVVNGLKVLCDPCGEVRVTTGHAISPCGDDIILCEDTSVAICDLIRRCRDSERKKLDCDPPRGRRDSACEDLEEEWVLAVKYDERATRGVTPLRTGTCASCGGGGATCGCTDCGCDACCSPAAPCEAPRPRGAPATCEPTVICEGYRFCVYRKPERDPQGDPRRLRLFDEDAPLIRQLLCCLELLTATFPTLPGDLGDDLTPAARRELVRLCCRFKANLVDYFNRHPHTNCEITGILATLRCPDPEQEDGFGQALMVAYLSLLAIWLDGLKQCICLALLPPAPAPICEDRVALATVRVRVRDCKVLRVCNWTTERDLLISWPAVTYWLGSLGIWDMLRQALDNICCANLLDLFDDFTQGDLVGAAPQAGLQPDLNAATMSVETATPAQPAARRLGEATGAAAAAPRALRLSGRLDEIWRGIMPGLGLDFGDLELADFVAETVARWDEPVSLSTILNASSPRFRNLGEGPGLGAAQMERLPETLALDMIAKPLLAGLVGAGKGLDLAAARPAAPREPPPATAELRAELDRQRTEIEILKRAVAGRKE